VLGSLIKTNRMGAKDLAHCGHLEGFEAIPSLDAALVRLQDLVLL